MSDTELPQLLERMGERASVGQLPLDGIIEGAARRRRTRTGFALGAAGAVVVIAGATGILTQSGDSAHKPVSPVASPTPSHGQTGASADLALPCPASSQRRVDLDIPGPGRPTPGEAVAPYAPGASKLVEVQGEERGAAVVHALNTEGTVIMTFELTLHDDGWWPDGYAECAD